jgi:polyisoprenyl-phosphate glycosyltransferase
MSDDLRPPRPTEYTLSVVVPAYNEAETLPELHRRLTSVLDTVGATCEVIYINDGSRDKTIAVMRALRTQDGRVTVIDLSRNFGKEIALTAGLDHARGDAVIVIDADLQDPPELIPDLIAEWRNGFDVVYAKRIARDGETALKKLTAAAFYRVIRAISRTQIPADTGDFRLLSRRAVDALKQIRERHRFMKGLFAWIGFPQKAVEYKRDPRHAGTTTFNYWKLWNFAIEGITSFTTGPLKFATYAGIVVAFVSFIYALVIVYETLVHGNPVPGYPSLMVAVLFLGGVQLLCIGIMGEYLGRLFNESKNRPLYLVNEYSPAPSIQHGIPEPQNAPQSAASR